MTTTNRATTPVLVVAVAPPSAHPLGGVDRPDPTRDFFAGCVATFTLPRYTFTGPPNPLSRSLADVVREVAS